MLLDTRYFHVVFTVPHELNVLALENAPACFTICLFTASAETACQVAADPAAPGSRDRRAQHSAHLGTEPGPSSARALRDSRWRAIAGWHGAGCARAIPFFLPVKVLSRVFRGKFLAGLTRVHRRKQLRAPAPLAALADPAVRGPASPPASPRLGGLRQARVRAVPSRCCSISGRYTHRVAISNHRLVLSMASA